MASITAFLKSAVERLRRGALLLLLLPALVWAAEIEALNPALTSTEEGQVLSADFYFDLSPRLEEAVNRGVVLHFVAEFELTRERWYWLDDKLLSRSLSYRLSYHALTRQYRLSTGGGLHQSFESLGDALAVLRRMRNWLVIARDDPRLTPGASYQAALRLQLDVRQLPRPFQIDALGNKDWNLSGNWLRWPVTLPTTTEGK